VGFLTIKDECDSIISPLTSQNCCLIEVKRLPPFHGTKWFVKSGKNGKVFLTFSPISNSLVKIHNPFLFLILLCGDIHPNPGPKTFIGTFNVRGASDKVKTKRLLNYAASLSKNFDRFIYSFQETHINDTRKNEIEYAWRGEFILSPGQTNARGVLTIFNSSFFDRILYKHADRDGRTTWLAGDIDGVSELFVSVYAPNSGKNKLFYTSLFKQIRLISEQYNIVNTYISGDFNIDLLVSAKGNNGRISKEFHKELKRTKLDFIKDKYKVSWNHGSKFSTLDYIFLSRHLSKFITSYSTTWGVDKSDHAAIELTIDTGRSRGKGMFRPDCTFLDSPELSSQFRVELADLCSQIDSNWNPHHRLEFVKVCIRTLLTTYSKNFTNTLNRNLELTRSELNKLMSFKANLTNPSQSQHPFMLATINRDIALVRSNLHIYLAEKSKFLATRARVNWLENGERSNKYFLNIIHKNSFKSCLNKMHNELTNEITSDSSVICDIAFNFYSKLYNNETCDNPDNFLNTFESTSINVSEAEILTKPFDSTELSQVLKRCGNTASGPDGIGFKLLKRIWDIYNPYLIDSWNYGLTTKILAPSHRESVICLIEKKGKDPKKIQNLRPISLSNCDLKIITKGITHRFKNILPRIIHPMQAAYIKDRQVHDNLRLISLIKDYCSNKTDEPILVSLDARKAFDSVNHDFIKAILRKYNAPLAFINTFELLYNDIHSRVLINGHFTEPFQIKRSVKQGDALSCVLFNLCIDSLIRSLEANKKISRILINNCTMPCAIAYADDVAIITNAQTLQHTFNTYYDFSRVSGLYLNVDKTEILRLSPLSKINKFFLYDNNNKPFSINAVSAVKICGITFANDSCTEYAENVTAKIDNLDKALIAWRKRSLSIFGRNLVLKTFGISQILYSMQNSFFSEASIKKINSICFNFLWNKKPDKIKAFERVSRGKLIKPINAGGISAPNISSINKALKVKQFLRSIVPSNVHVISTLQNELIGNLELFNCSYTKSDFINSSLKYLNELGMLALDEITADNGLKINKNYYNLLASTSMTNLINIKSKNNISAYYAHTIARDLGVIKVKHVLFENKFPRSSYHAHMLQFIVNSNIKIFNILEKRKSLDEFTSFFDCIPVGINRMTKVQDLTTKQLTHRFSFGNKSLDNDLEECRLYYGSHPKENEVHWLHFNNACLSRLKLFDMKLVDSPLCPICNTLQSTDHILFECTNAELVWNVLKNDFNTCFNNIEFRLGSSDRQKNELLMHAKRLIFLNKNEPLDKTFIISLFTNRISDLKSIRFNKFRKSLMMQNSRAVLS